MYKHCAFLLIFLAAGVMLASIQVTATRHDETTITGILVNMNASSVTLTDSLGVSNTIYTSAIIKSYTIGDYEQQYTFPVLYDDVPNELKAYWKFSATTSAGGANGYVVRRGFNNILPDFWAGPYVDLTLGFQSSKDLNSYYEGDIELSPGSFSFAIGAQFGYKDLVKLAYMHGWRTTSLVHPDVEVENGRLTLSTNRFMLKVAPWYLAESTQKPRIKVYALAGFGNSPSLEDEIGINYEDGQLTMFGLEFCMFNYTGGGGPLYEAALSLALETIKYQKITVDHFSGSFNQETKLNTFRINVRLGLAFNLSGGSSNPEQPAKN